MKKKKKQKKLRKKTLHWKKWLKNSGISFAFIAIFVGSFIIYTNNKKGEYDLSVIGNGMAAVVQIHDPNCQLCRRLKNNVDSVKKDFQDRIQFKIANISSPKGRAFAQHHKVPHVTLLFFNKRGQKVNVLQGVSSKEAIKAALTTLQR